MYIIFDTETTGLPQNYKAPASDTDNWPRLVQLAYQWHEANGNLIAHDNVLIRPEGFDIPYEAAKVHGISTERALKEGQPLAAVMEAFLKIVEQAQCLVAHNASFDLRIVDAELCRLQHTTMLEGNIAVLDTMLLYTEHVQKTTNKRVKWPRLEALHQTLFGVAFDNAHDAAIDTSATAKCFFEMQKQGIIQSDVPAADIHYTAPTFPDQDSPQDDLPDSTEAAAPPQPIQATEPSTAEADKSPKLVADTPPPPVRFGQIYVRSQFSVIASALSTEAIIEMAKKHGNPAVGLCDMGNMHGGFQFITQAHKAGIKPILGCELFLSYHPEKKQFSKQEPDRRFLQPLIAESLAGYTQLSALCSWGHTHGLYGIYPRVHRDQIAADTDGLLALSGGLQGELAYTLLHQGKAAAEKVLQWWMKHFEGRYYLQLVRHGREEDGVVNEALLSWAAQYQLPVIPTWEIFYEKETDVALHDTLLCIKAGIKKSDSGYANRQSRDLVAQKNHHYRPYAEMKTIFADVPEAFDHLQALIDRVQDYTLHRDIQLPVFQVPDAFKSQNDYLTHLTHEGATQLYGSITPPVQERLEKELAIIQQAGYAGYFLIVQEIVQQARIMGVAVGPGRGSVGGALVAYVLGITQIDPLQYGLLFERFLNPDRISMPDIDIDFDDEKRDKVVQWMVQRYGKNQVAQIITYGTMAARSAIRDCARVLELPLPDADRIAKQVEDGMDLKKNCTKGPLKKVVQNDPNPLVQEVLRQAQQVEGTVRNFSIHACGVIIAPSPLDRLVPLTLSKDTDLLVTQYDNNVIEHAGLLKMDILGLRTLSILRTTIAQVQQQRNTILALENIPLDDKPTYAMLGKGQTIGVFQFESNGMQRYLSELKPDRFEDLIAMNALYRPGPMEYIRSFIARKHKRETIKYDLPIMEKVLAETYGITVYQEQVMLLSVLLADFTQGQADTLRYAMGKKHHQTLQKLQPTFLAGFTAKGYDEVLGRKIWKDWEAFASYAFNKSHATSYALLAYQTAYCKANYPAEYMTALLTHHQDQNKVAFLIEECRSRQIAVVPPCVNNSDIMFSITPEGDIRYGLSAAKGISKIAMQTIIQERTAKGHFTGLKDFAQRMNLQQLGKKNIECLVGVGALDLFEEAHRKQYLTPIDGSTLIDKLIKWHNRSQTTQPSLFGATLEDNSFEQFCIGAHTNITPYTKQERVEIEKELAGIGLSGNLLSDWELLIPHICNRTLKALADKEAWRPNHTYTSLGIVVDCPRKTTKTGKNYYLLELEDLTGAYRFPLWEETYNRVQQHLTPGQCLWLQGSVLDRNHANKAYFDIKRLIPLPEDLHSLVRYIQITAPIEQITDEWVELLAHALDGEQAAGANADQNPNDTPLKTHWLLYDAQTKRKVPLELTRNIAVRHLEWLSKSPHLTMQIVLK